MKLFQYTMQHHLEFNEQQTTFAHFLSVDLSDF